MMKIPLGLKPSMGITYQKLLQRSGKRLRLLHSGQGKVDYLVRPDYLRGALLTVENDEFVLLAPILGPEQGDLLGYPPPAVTALTEETCFGQAAGGAPAATPTQSNKGQTCSDDMALDLGAALDAASSSELGLNVGTPFPMSRRLAPAVADRLAVDQTLACVEASSRMLSALVDICETSDDVVVDIQQLERLTGLKSAPARHYIAAREPELVADIDGHRVPFSAPAIRTEVAGKDVVRIQVHLLQTRAENDILRAEVMGAVGTGVAGGVSTLGQHDVRFVGLEDWQRGALLILRGARVPLNLGVTEAISAARLVRRPALVVDPVDWSELRRAALDALSGLETPVPGLSTKADEIGSEPVTGADRDAA